MTDTTGENDGYIEESFHVAELGHVDRFIIPTSTVERVHGRQIPVIRIQTASPTPADATIAFVGTERSLTRASDPAESAIDCVRSTRSPPPSEPSVNTGSMPAAIPMEGAPCPHEVSRTHQHTPAVCDPPGNPDDNLEDGSSDTKSVDASDTPGGILKNNELEYGFHDDRADEQYRIHGNGSTGFVPAYISPGQGCFTKQNICKKSEMARNLVRKQEGLLKDLGGIREGLKRLENELDMLKAQLPTSAQTVGRQRACGPDDDVSMSHEFDEPGQNRQSSPVSFSLRGTTLGRTSGLGLPQNVLDRNISDMDLSVYPTRILHPTSSLRFPLHPPDDVGTRNTPAFSKEPIRRRAFTSRGVASHVLREPSASYAAHRSLGRYSLHSQTNSVKYHHLVPSGDVSLRDKLRSRQDTPFCKYFPPNVTSADVNVFRHQRHLSGNGQVSLRRPWRPATSDSSLVHDFDPGNEYGSQMLTSIYRKAFGYTRP